jgi:lysophospholipase
MSLRPLTWALDRTYRRRDQAGCGFAFIVALALCLSGCQRPAPPAAQTRIPPGLQSRYFPPPGWTWGRLEIEGAPPLRYGVGVQPKATRGSVLILPGYAEPAEAWFETAGELIRAGYAVWVLDLAGQGGSGRWLSAGDKAHLPSMQPNLDAVRRMVLEVVRPAPGAPFVLIGSDLGGQVALRSAAAGLPELDAVILSAPSLSDSPLAVPWPFQSGALARGATLIGLDGRYAPGQGKWRSEASRAAPAGSRAAVPQAWMRANPSLRTGGATWGWIRAYSASVQAARAPQTLRAVAVPVLMFDAGGGAGRAACEGLRSCRYAPVPAGLAPHLLEGARREAWRAAVDGFIARQSTGYSLATAPVGTAP